MLGIIKRGRSLTLGFLSLKRVALFDSKENGSVILGVGCC